MNVEKLKKLLSEFDQYQVERYINYCNRLLTEKKNGQIKNPWMSQRSDNVLASYFKSVNHEGLEFDGQDITIQVTGVSYGYQAYKNKMLLSYPESIIDIQLVYKDDTFRFSKESGKVIYKHDINNPFGNENAEDEIVGGYCVIKNKRGEFITFLNKEDIQKRRKKAKFDTIWKEWYKEMCWKSILKRACTEHFKDTFSSMETLDNESVDLDKPLGISIETKQQIENITTEQGLVDYYRVNHKKNVGVHEDFIKALAARKSEIVEELSNEQ